MPYLHKSCWKKLKHSGQKLINADLGPDEWTHHASPGPKFEICITIQKDKSLLKISPGDKKVESWKHECQDKGQDPALLLH